MSLILKCALMDSFHFFFSGLAAVSFCSVIYLHIPPNNTNSSNVPEVPIYFISNLYALIPINYRKRLKSKSFLLLIAEHTILKTDYNIPNQSSF